MGRVDEAMRRVVEAGSDAAELVGQEMRPEAFPTEVPEVSYRPRTRPDGGDTPGPLPAVLPPLTSRLATTLSRKTVIDDQMDPVSREQYRRLATGLHAGQAAHGLKVVAVISAIASEGKSLTASNLALTLSESYQRSVLLIDGDLRRPSIETVFGLPSGNGLSDGLLATGPQRRLTLHRVTHHLTVLTSGHPTNDPMAALASERLRQLIDEARETYDWVVIDTPPIGLLSDANLLADAADGALLVVKAESTPYDVVQRAVAAIGKDRILGVILNQAHEVGNASYYKGYYHGTSTS